MSDDELKTVAQAMAKAMFMAACHGRVSDYNKDRQAYYLPKAQAVLKVFQQSTSIGEALAEEVSRASFNATIGIPINWRYEDYRIYYLPVAQAALAEAQRLLDVGSLPYLVC